MQLQVINTGFFKLDGGAMFGVVPKSLWQRINPPDAKNLCTWAMRCLLVKTANRLVLIDTGIGDKQSAKFFSHFEPHGSDSLLQSLADLGYVPSQITDVILTHLHFDHCGGAVKRLPNGELVPLFPNAKYWSNAEHWAWAMEPNPREKASFLKENFVPIQEHQQLYFATDGQEIAPNIRVHFVYGHTHAMMLPHITYGNKTIVYMADLIPSVGHIRMPYVMAYDVQPLHTLNEKHSYLTAAVKHEQLLFLEHDPTFECCTVKNTSRGIGLDQTFTLQDWLHQ